MLDKNPCETAISQVKKLSVAEAAKLMDVSQQFIRVGLQTGRLPFGSAVKISGNRYTYYISPEKFREYTGLEDISCPT